MDGEGPAGPGLTERRAALLLFHAGRRPYRAKWASEVASHPMGWIEHQGVKLHYLEEGTGEPVLLLHGLASHAAHSWQATSWMSLLAANYRVIAPDSRGHGDSDKFDIPEAYGLDRLLADLVALLDSLQLPSVRVLGYSMGGWVALGLAIHYPRRVRAVVAGGIGINITRPTDPARTQRLAQSIIHPGDGLEDDPGGEFRKLCRRTGNEPAAIATFLRRPRTGVDELGVRGLAMPVLLVAGEADPFARDLEAWRALIPQAETCVLARRHHMNALVDQGFKKAVVDFLARVSPPL